MFCQNLPKYCELTDASRHDVAAMQWNGSPGGVFCTFHLKSRLTHLKGVFPPGTPPESLESALAARYAGLGIR